MPLAYEFSVGTGYSGAINRPESRLLRMVEREAVGQVGGGQKLRR